jgi:fatty-acyl-CoA synthase
MQGSSRRTEFPESRMGVCDLFRDRARMQPDAVALVDGAGSSITYSALADRAARAAGALRALGLRRGDRIAVWSENCFAYVELELAAAQLGLIVACLNWRLSDEEQQHCIALVEPSLVVVSERHAPAWKRLALRVPHEMRIDASWDERMRAQEPALADAGVDAEDGLVILYTSGTTGLPKGALVSQRAMVARAMVFSAEFGVRGSDSFIAWSPLFHMAATDHTLATLMLGGKVLVLDGLQLPEICAWIAAEPIGWLLAMPGMIESLTGALREHRVEPRSVRMVGAMADLVPLQQLAQLTAAVRAPYLNTFGSTETGLPPATASLLAPGELPRSLAKHQSSWCLVRLVDAGDEEVPQGSPGEMTVRGPTLFSGYWGNERATAESFRGGWFHMGDVFVRHADGTLDFVDRLKYLIKSGGENIYPAEIERVLLAHPAVRDAAVVRKPDTRWGEVPVAFVACEGGACDESALIAFCRERLAGYKQPKEVRLIAIADFPRSSTGKIQRHELEKRL